MTMATTDMGEGVGQMPVPHHHKTLLKNNYQPFRSMRNRHTWCETTIRSHENYCSLKPDGYCPQMYFIKRMASKWCNRNNSK